MCEALPHRPPVSSTKGWTGHALGAAGITEALITAFALERAMGAAHARLHDAGSARSRADVAIASYAAPLRHALTNSFGFGGNNCSLVLSRRA